MARPSLGRFYIVLWVILDGVLDGVRGKGNIGARKTWGIGDHAAGLFLEVSFSRGIKMHNNYWLYTYPHGDRSLAVVAQNFSYMAAFFGTFWFLYHKMWWQAATWIMSMMIFALLVKEIAYAPDMIGTVSATIFATHLFFSLLIGEWGNEWRRMHLERKGWAMIAVIQAKSSISALNTYHRALIRD